MEAEEASFCIGDRFPQARKKLRADGCARTCRCGEVQECKGARPSEAC